ncbi:hypothetical protein CYMTET_34432 [Cymbomonas tetramitiformis]|uniref:Major facilitator superfamily (MFS) profile domain-containing protein n=1 Tax=Cymbomonas tetramitiformis TaxID=36881 RepID=A0AAE0FBP3_9CHLO|nr:hypothetical protein CYMTET_34432 [Cymbomonas tetramitiformis]
MGLIGLFYALSQGVVAKPLIRAAGRDPTKLLLVCIMLLGGIRPFALFTRSISMLYLLYMPMVIALGVMNTAITSACSSMAGGDQLGGLFGVLEAVESLAGMIGPAIGGLLSRGHAQGPIGAVCALYEVAALLVFLYFDKHVSGCKVQGHSTSYGKGE